MLIKIALGTVRLGFVTSPPTIKPDSTPTNAKNRIKEVCPKSFRLGKDSICKIEIETSFHPKNTNKSKGISFITVFNLTRPIPCFIPITLIKANPEKMMNKKHKRIHPVPTAG